MISRSNYPLPIIIIITVFCALRATLFLLHNARTRRISHWNTYQFSRTQKRTNMHARTHAKRPLISHKHTFQMPRPDENIICGAHRARRVARKWCGYIYTMLIHGHTLVRIQSSLVNLGRGLDRRGGMKSPL